MGTSELLQRDAGDEEKWIEDETAEANGDVEQDPHGWRRLLQHFVFPLIAFISMIAASDVGFAIVMLLQGRPVHQIWSVLIAAAVALLGFGALGWITWLRRPRYLSR